ncbi:phage scaffolding protein (plasmid) [Staphylococcus delphini]|uniref:phage scaffolding protein n=1 Tax=Staphylococcus delphini TaxID=53344 RepID=UPI0033651151
MEIKELLEKYKNGEIEQSAVLESVEALKSDMVPRSRLNDKNEEIKELNAELEKRNDQITELQKSVGDNQELQNKLKEYEDSNAKHADEMNKLKLNTAIKLAVAKDANDANDVLTLLNKDNLELKDDGSVQGLDDAVKALREAKPYLFGASKKGKTPFEGGQPKLTREDIMSIQDPAQRQKAIKENMNLFN